MSPKQRREHLWEHEYMVFQHVCPQMLENYVLEINTGREFQK